MSKARKKLEERADELGLSFVPDTSDEDLEQLITDFEFEEPTDPSADMKYYRSPNLAGLSVQIGDEPDRTEQPTEVRFSPYEERDKKTGDLKRVGYLATDEQDAQEILGDDPNVQEITETEYREATENGTPARR